MAKSSRLSVKERSNRIEVQAAHAEFLDVVMKPIGAQHLGRKRSGYSAIKASRRAVTSSSANGNRWPYTSKVTDIDEWPIQF